MDLEMENALLSAEEEKPLKRKHPKHTKRSESKKQKLVATEENAIDEGKLAENEDSGKTTDECNTKLIPVHRSPKKRIEVQHNNKTAKNKQKFIYGNYSQYYGYRNKDKDYHDIRLDMFAKHQEVFENKNILDIGCNSGFITTEVAKKLPIKNIVGLDIDSGLIKQATKNLVKLKKGLPFGNPAAKEHRYPYNISFQHGNYVLRDDVLLEIEREQFEVILCLSVTKWIHLNFGDAGLKQAFKRMYLQLKPGGVLILEAQPFDNYARRKKMTDTIFRHYKAMQFFPKDFTDYLLSSEVGFSRVESMGVPENCTAGFKRPVQMFFKQ